MRYIPKAGRFSVKAKLAVSITDLPPVPEVRFRAGSDRRDRKGWTTADRVDGGPSGRMVGRGNLAV